MRIRESGCMAAALVWLAVSAVTVLAQTTATGSSVTPGQLLESADAALNGSGTADEGAPALSDPGASASLTPAGGGPVTPQGAGSATGKSTASGTAAGDLLNNPPSVTTFASLYPYTGKGSLAARELLEHASSRGTPVWPSDSAPQFGGTTGQRDSFLQAAITAAWGVEKEAGWVDAMNDALTRTSSEDERAAIRKRAALATQNIAAMETLMHSDLRKAYNLRSISAPENTDWGPETNYLNDKELADILRNYR